MAYNWNPFDPANDMWGAGSPVITQLPTNTRPQGGTTPGGITLGAQQRPPTGANYYPTPYSGGGTTTPSTTTSTSTGPVISGDGKWYFDGSSWKPMGGTGGTGGGGGSNTSTQRTAAAQPDYSLQIAQMNADLQRQELAQQAAQFAQEQAWYREQQAAELEAEKQRQLATLAAQPKSWLEYAALANQQPVVQPWMLPLMPRQYSNVQAGQPIPGWAADNMQGMPDLTRPSAQYLARLGPTAQEQYYGYQQADTGAPADSQYWLNQSTAPPGTSYKPLSYQR